MSQKASSPPPAPFDELAWLIRGRFKIQKQLRRILFLMEEYKIPYHNDDYSQSVSSLLHAAAFSLWRSVFLTHLPQERKENLIKAEKYIKKTLETNMITYTDDSNLQGWAFAYYQNNAYLRLQILCSTIDGLKEELGTEVMKHFQPPLVSTHNANTYEIWDTHCFILKKAVNLFEKKLKSMKT